MSWTVQKLIDEKIGIHVYCMDKDCRHHVDLDLAAVKAKLGPDAPMMRDDLLPRLKCTVCGGKRIDLTYAPSGTLTPGGAHGH